MVRLSYEDVGITEPEEGVIEFEITKDHLTLLRHLQLEWVDEHGGYLRTNPKRPYGPPNTYEWVRTLIDPALTAADIERLHRGAVMALQIALKTGKFKASTFYASKYGQDWKERGKKKVKVGDEPEQGSLPLEAAEAGADA